MCYLLTLLLQFRTVCQISMIDGHQFLTCILIKISQHHIINNVISAPYWEVSLQHWYKFISDSLDLHDAHNQKLVMDILNM